MYPFFDNRCTAPAAMPPELELSCVSPFRNSVEHLFAELKRIDLLIASQVRRARQSQTRDDLQGLYISEQEVDLLLAQPLGMPRWASIFPELDMQATESDGDQTRTQLTERIIASERAGISLRLVTLARTFELTQFDIEVVLICLAAEIDLRYERLYAYLQDDVTKKRPTVDLLLNLTCPSFSDKLLSRERFLSGSPLVRHQIVVLLEDPAYPKTQLLSRFAKLDDRIVNYLLGEDEIDSRLRPYLSLIDSGHTPNNLGLPSDVRHSILNLLDGYYQREARLNVYLQGPYGVGKRSLAEAFCQLAGRKLLLVDGEHLAAAADNEFVSIVQLVVRESILQEAALYWDRFDVLLSEEHHAARKALIHEIQQRSQIVFLAGEVTWEPADVAGTSFVRIELPRPAYAERLHCWEETISNAPNVDSRALANKFSFTGGQIRDAACTAGNLARQRNPEQPSLTTEIVLEACRLQSNHRLAKLAKLIRPHYTFADIVLPADRFRQLQEICQAIEHRSLVYDDWGFDAKLSLGKGMSVLFAGPSGTGKTMAAEVLARQLGLDLYKIDLSSMVSKYIGETEKNLSRLFAEAETSNAILFFDEADALFGKRSEVRDAHDRYANIEINYLLQKIEEYEGVVILATNLRKNMDEAFTRRIYSIIEFPLPGIEHRLQIWHGVWPSATPRGDLDLEFMARRFELTGGNIRNIALAAAFLAAEEGGGVQMSHLIRATYQEFQKTGKVIIENEFGKYAALAQPASSS
jgi:SpoVK/Ycf46/Vps4 family AAA+-type ATPase